MIVMKLVLAVLCAAVVRADPPVEADQSPSPSEEWSPVIGGGEAADRDVARSAEPTEERKDVHKVTITKKVRVPYTVHVEKRIPKIIEVPVDKPFNVYVPKPYPVVVEKKVPYEIKVPQPQPYTVEKRVPYPVKVLVDKPYTLHVPKPYPVNVEKKYEFTVEKKVPYEVKVPVERPYPVHVIVEKEVKFPVEKKVPVPVKVPYDKPIPIHVTKHVPVNVDKPVPYTVEKVTTYPVKVPFSIPIKVHYPEGGSVDEGSNAEWVEAVNSATTAAKSEYQGYGESPVVTHHDDFHQSRWQDHRSIRQGFSMGRGLLTRHGYLLGKHVYKRPTTKLQQVAHHYQVKESHFERPHQYLNRPSHAPQMVFAAPQDFPGLHGTKPENSLQPTALNSYSHFSHGFQNDTSAASHPQQLSSVNSGFSSHTSNQQPGSHPSSGLSSQSSSEQQGLIDSYQSAGHSSQSSSQQQGLIGSYQSAGFSSQSSNGHPNRNSTPSFIFSNVVYHTATPQQSRTPFALPLRMNRLEQAHRNLGSESAQLLSATFYRTNSPIRMVENGQTLVNRTPFGGSGYTISFRSPGSAQQQTNGVESGNQLFKQHREASAAGDINHSRNQLFKPEQQALTAADNSRSQLFQQLQQTSANINNGRSQHFKQHQASSTDGRNQLFQQQQQTSTDVSNGRSQLFGEQQASSTDSRNQLFQQQQQTSTDVSNGRSQLFGEQQESTALDVSNGRNQLFPQQQQTSTNINNGGSQLFRKQQASETTAINSNGPQDFQLQQATTAENSNSRPQLFAPIQPHNNSNDGPSSYVTVRDSYSSSIQHQPPQPNSAPA